eukprot:symbB.v1.2.022250.t2/scaffold1931.1/size95788/1
MQDAIGRGYQCRASACGAMSAGKPWCSWSRPCLAITCAATGESSSRLPFTCQTRMGVRWYAMAFGDTEDARFEEISEVTDRYNPNQKVTIRKPIEREITLEPDGDSHSYQIVGTWSGHNPEEMSCKDDTWTFGITLGENRWESFYLIQDNDFEKQIMPNVPKANKEAVPVGPLNRPKHAGSLRFPLVTCHSTNPTYPLTKSHEHRTTPADLHILGLKTSRMRGVTRWVHWVRWAVPALPIVKLGGAYFVAPSAFAAMSGDKRLREALVWVDCEMTGLGSDGGPGDDSLLEVAVLITDEHLQLVAEGPDIVLHHPDAVLDGMNDWCKDQFGWDDQQKKAKPGLLADEVQKSKATLEETASGLRFGTGRTRPVVYYLFA